jgi:hypothetical protein
MHVFPSIRLDAGKTDAAVIKIVLTVDPEKLAVFLRSGCRDFESLVDTDILEASLNGG